MLLEALNGDELIVNPLDRQFVSLCSAFLFTALPRHAIIVLDSIVNGQTAANVVQLPRLRLNENTSPCDI
jgi:hypothetical protein